MLTLDHVAETQALLNAQDKAHPEPNRRDTLKTIVIGAAYASAAAPLMAQTAIQTSAQGLKAGETHFEVNGFQVPAYYAMPEGEATGKLPVILVVQEIFGVHAYIADTVRRFAKAGYLAIAPELYARQGDAGAYNDMASLMSELVSKVPDAQVLADLDGAVQWAVKQGGDVARVGITGFCWGGRITWLYALQRKAVKAGVAWYGRLVGQSSPLQPQHPLDLAANLSAPVLGLYGGADTGIPVDTVDKMRAALKDAASKGNAAAGASEFVVYPDTPHAFHADYRPSYRQAPAEDGWKRALAWFKKYGV